MTTPRRGRTRTVRRPQARSYRGGSSSAAFRSDWAIWVALCADNNVSPDATSQIEASSDWTPPNNQGSGNFSFDSFGGDSTGGSSSGGYSDGGSSSYGSSSSYGDSGSSSGYTGGGDSSGGGF